MPYIYKSRRSAVDPDIETLASTLEALNSKKGDLNYVITRLVLAYCDHHGICYDTCSDITGVLTDVRSEFERRVMGPYEDEKIKQNGDVYLLHEEADADA
jgi:hypothetical protein